MLRIMAILFLILVVISLNAQRAQNETSYTGVYRSIPLFIQNPYLSRKKKYCISQITVNKKRVSINYDVSALILDFEGIDRFTPIYIHIEHVDSTCVPILLNPEAIRYHSVFSFEKISITDSSLVWNTKGESENGTYEIEAFNLGYWESLNVKESNGVYGGSDYVYYPVYDEGSNKYRIKYSSNSSILYSEEIEYVFYPGPITFRREANELILSRSCTYVVSDKENFEVLTGLGKAIDISELKSGEYYITFNDEQSEIFKKNDRVKVYRKVKQNN